MEGLEQATAKKKCDTDYFLGTESYLQKPKVNLIHTDYKCCKLRAKTTNFHYKNKLQMADERMQWSEHHLTTLVYKKKKSCLRNGLHSYTT